MKLNRTGSNWNRLERNKINENWDIIEGSYNDVVGQITDEVVGHLIDSARLDWKEPVDTVEDLPANAEVGETRMVREADPDGISYVYRYDGEQWEKIQAIDVTLVNEVDRRLTAQLAQTASNRIDRGINVLKPPKGLPIPKADGVIDDTQALQAITNYSKEKNLPIYMPDRDYLIKGRLFFYTSVKCDGQIILHNDDVGHAVLISPTKPRIDLDVSLLSGMNEDSTKITGLPQNIRGATLIIQSNERLIKRNNVVDPWYFKQDSFVVYDNEGTVFPKVDDTYTDLSKITEVYYRE